MTVTISSQEKEAWVEENTFRCERLHARISIAACQAYQIRQKQYFSEQTIHTLGGKKYVFPTVCRDCERRIDVLPTSIPRRRGLGRAGSI